MNSLPSSSEKILIVAGASHRGEEYRRVFHESGYQTALVWNHVQFVDFCRVQSPDVILLDSQLADWPLWNAVQATKGFGTTANARCIIFGEQLDSATCENAQRVGVNEWVDAGDGAMGVLAKVSENQSSTTAAEASDRPIDSDRTLERLRVLAHDMVETANRLRPRVPEYGADGPELFGYIEGSGQKIVEKLRGVATLSLHERSLRHDFRNLIGSVTGFSELLLMENGLSQESHIGLRRLREFSREFVGLLDEQKSSAGSY